VYEAPGERLIGAFRLPRLLESRPMSTIPRRQSRSLPGRLPQAAPGEVLIWTDGACQRNPGPGGWAALVCWEDGVIEEHSGGMARTTNNVMEMTAALEGLRALPPGSRACVVTDSRYLHDGMTSWLAGWKRKDWRTASGQPVKNKEIWVQLDAAASDHERVRWHWVKGHIGHMLNERADLLAVAATRHAVARS
jgi:ribonuclease HI